MPVEVKLDGKTSDASRRMKRVVDWESYVNGMFLICRTHHEQVEHAHVFGDGYDVLPPDTGYFAEQALVKLCRRET